MILDLRRSICTVALLAGLVALVATGCGSDGTSTPSDDPEEIGDGVTDGSSGSDVDTPDATSDATGDDTGDSSTTHECVVGTTRCSDDRTLLLCGPDGEEMTVRCASDEACGQAGDRADCIRIAACSPDDRWCADDVTVRTCDNDDGADEPCPIDEICRAGTCVPSSGCTIGTARCRDAVTLLACRADSEEIVRCASDEVCTGDYPEADCENTGECPAGTSICIDGSRLRTCGNPEDGWQEVACEEGESCIDGQCRGEDPGPACTPDATRCQDGERQVCATDGETWIAVPCDAGLACQDGQCVDDTPDPICTPAATRCADEDTLETCNGAGDAWMPTACGTGRSCEDGECVDDGTPVACTPGERRCAGANTQETCSDAGDAWVPAACGTGRSCENGECVDDGPPVICTPGSSRCADEETEEACSSDGTAWIANPCGNGRICEFGACTTPPDECTPGERTCDGNSARVCNALGNEWSVTPCGDRFCNDGLCRDLCPGATESNWGCSFHAIHLDQADVPCSTTTDCAQLPGSTCQNNLCRYSATSRERFALAIANVTDEPNTVTIRNAAGTVVETVVFEPQAATLVQVPVPGGHRTGSRIGFEAFRVESTRAISVIQHNPPPHINRPTGGGTILTPDDQLGLEFDVLSWPSRIIDDVPYATWITIVAVEEGTTVVDVLPYAFISSGTGVAAQTRFQRRDYALQQGQSVTLYARLPATEDEISDLSGSLLTASAPVAVFAGSRCSTIPHGTEACDHLEHQVPPISRHGSRYIVTRTSIHSQMPDVIRILNSDTAFTVRILTTPEVPGLHNEEVQIGTTIEALVNNSHVRIDAERLDGAPARIAVAQFSPGRYYPCTLNIAGFWNCPQTLWDNRCIQTPIGGPSFMHLLPTTSYARQHRVHIPQSTQRVYADIISSEGPLPRVNGASIGGTHVGSSEWRSSRRELSPGTHLIEGDSPIGVHLHGKGCGSAWATMLGGGAP